MSVGVVKKVMKSYLFSKVDILGVKRISTVYKINEANYKREMSVSGISNCA